MSLILPEVQFADAAEMRRTLDARRFRAGERNTRRRRSPIQGWGSFATRRIEQGESVFVSEQVTGNFPVNHSLAPNIARAANRCGLFALRTIEAGEEITEDYRFLPFFGQAIPVVPFTLVAATPEEYRDLLGREGLGFTLPGRRPGRAAGAAFHPSAPLPGARR